MERVDAIVVGAGITGLSCARHLASAGRTVRVFESSDRAGGVVSSERIDGVGVIDLGPQTIRSGDADFIGDVEALGLGPDRLVAGSAGAHRFIWRDGELVALPHGPGEFLRSPVLTFRAKLRMLTEPFRRARPGADESVADFFSHRLGPQVASDLVDPFVSGVYAGAPDRLSMRAVFPTLKEGVDRRGSLLRWGLGELRARRAARRSSGPSSEGTARRRPELFSFRGGLGQWIDAMARAAGPGALRTNERVTAIDPVDDGWVVRTEAGELLHGREVLLAVPAAALARLCAGRFEAPARSIADVPYAPVSTVHLAYRRDRIAHPLDGFGYLCPSNQARPILGVLWISSLFPERVEPGWVLTTTFIGGARQASNALLPEHRLIEIAHREHARVLGAEGVPSHARTATHRQAIPQYEFGHLERVAAADDIESVAPGLHLAGAWRNGVSVPDCWKNGRAAAERMLERLSAGEDASAPVAGLVEGEGGGLG